LFSRVSRFEQPEIMSRNTAKTRRLPVIEVALSNVEIVFCVFLAENNFVKALIPFFGVKVLDSC
jgi:hypothetical protein